VAIFAGVAKRSACGGLGDATRGICDKLRRSRFAISRIGNSQGFENFMSISFVSGDSYYPQHDSLGAEKEDNWLPAPNGTFWMAMRLYWP
jgi:hypothetical protein